MQKVESSSLFIRFTKAPETGLSSFLGQADRPEFLPVFSQASTLARRTLVGQMARSSSSSFRLPPSLREQLLATAAAERRSLSSLVVALLDRGIVARAAEHELIRQMIEPDGGVDDGS